VHQPTLLGLRATKLRVGCQQQPVGRLCAQEAHLEAFESLAHGTLQVLLTKLALALLQLTLLL
jgi:hypothetical protein